MAVYVDDMYATYGRMKMCHMVADTDEELQAMANKIGVARRWFQKPGSPQRHYDISVSKRAIAVRYGAIEVTYRQLGEMVLVRRRTGHLGTPEGGMEGE